MTCYARAYPAVDSIDWFYEDAPINMNTSKIIPQDETMGKSDEFVSSLTVTQDVTELDQGVYKCIAKSNLGNDTEDFNITVLRKYFFRQTHTKRV